MKPEYLSNTYRGCLTRIIQEGAEVIQAATKLAQYGEYATDSHTGLTYDNVRILLSECNDFEHACAAIIAYCKRKNMLFPPPMITSEEYGLIYLVGNVIVDAAMYIGYSGQHDADHDHRLLLEYINRAQVEIDKLRLRYARKNIIVAMPNVPVIQIVDEPRSPL